MCGGGGGVIGSMARCQKQPFRCVKKQAQLGEAAHRAWQREDPGHYAERLPSKHDSRTALWDATIFFKYILTFFVCLVAFWELKVSEKQVTI